MSMRTNPHCTGLEYSTVQYSIVQYSIVQYFTLYYIVLHYIILHYSLYITSYHTIWLAKRDTGRAGQQLAAGQSSVQWVVWHAKVDTDLRV